jgi:hypothetical protein
MAVSALQNPNDRRRINKLARLAVKEGLDPSAAVALWLSQRGTAKKSRDKRLQRGDGKAAMAHIRSGNARKSTSKEKAALKKAKYAIARAFQAADPSGYKASRGKRGRKVSYAGRATKSHASRYLSSKKKGKGRPISSGKRKGQPSVVVNVAGVREFRAGRAGRRASSGFGHLYSPKGGRPFPARSGKGKSKARISQKGRKASPASSAALGEYRRLKAGAKAAGISVPRGTKLAELRNMQHAVANPWSALVPLRRNGSALVPLGDLAFTNPSMGAAGYFLGYAVPVTVAGGVAGGVHALASTYGLTGMISDGVAMIPGVGPMLAEKVPYTIQGLLVGGSLAFLASKIGGQAGKYLALTGGAALVLGGGIDAFNLALGSSEASDDGDINAALDEELQGLDAGGEAPVGDLAFTNGVARGRRPFGDLAFTNGGSALGDGFAWETAPLTMASDGSADYGQAVLADAEFCGADFSPREGQALLNGRGAWFSAYSNPPMRVARAELRASHLAGREGHRWGWLIKWVGWERAKNIVAMEPRQRVVVIHRLRKAALEAYARSIAEYQAKQAVSAVPAPQPAAGTAATGATGAQGVASPNSSYLGYGLGEPALFMGA